MQQFKTYTTTLGRVVKIRSIPPYLVAEVEKAQQKKAEALYPAPPKPTYTVTDAGGGEQIFEHDEKSVSTDEERAALAAYQTAMQNRANYAAGQVSEFMFERGLVVDLPADDSWAKEQEKWGVEIPTDPKARRDHYIKTEVLAGKDDIQEILLAIMAATGVDAEAVETARATFRGDLRQRQGQGTISPASGEIPVKQARPALDDIAALPGIGDGQSLGLDAGAMG